MNREEFNRKYGPDDLLKICDVMDNMPQKPFSDREILREDSTPDEVAEAFYNEKVVEFLSYYQSVLDSEKPSLIRLRPCPQCGNPVGVLVLERAGSYCKDCGWVLTKTVKFVGCKHLDFSDTHPEAKKHQLKNGKVFWLRSGDYNPRLIQYCCMFRRRISSAVPCLEEGNCGHYTPFEHEVEVKEC